MTHKQFDIPNDPLYQPLHVGHANTVYECKVGMPGEKAETRELKEKLAEYFRKKDIEGAKNYFFNSD